MEREISLTDVLAARERRVRRQQAWLTEYRVPLVCFTMNIAGPVKLWPAVSRAFGWGCAQLQDGFARSGWPVLASRLQQPDTGCEAFFAVDAPAAALKELCVAIEESEKFGRLFDMDVIGTDGQKLEREEERPCLVCGKAGRSCASRRLHTLEQLRAATEDRLACSLWQLDYDRASSAADAALREEVSVTPKPGLVDLENSGAHRDMDYKTFLASSDALRPYWSECLNTGRKSAQQPPAETFALLRPLGKAAERDMLAATGGINTHKGAIFTLGVLLGALGRCWTAGEGFPPAPRVLDECAAMTEKQLTRELAAARGVTAGERLYLRYGVRGIRGEVADGLQSVRSIGLPTFRALLAQGLSRNNAAAVTLLHLIARVEDSNLLHRGGREGAACAADAAKQLIENGRIPTLETIRALDRDFSAHGLSPGGCADLLAVTLFLTILYQTDETI